jgi:hypothetical protein
MMFRANFTWIVTEDEHVLNQAGSKSEAHRVEPLGRSRRGGGQEIEKSRSPVALSQCGTGIVLSCMGPTVPECT